MEQVQERLEDEATTAVRNEPLNAGTIAVSPASPLRAAWQRILALDEHTVIASLGFLCLFAANFMAPTDPDFWWHLATGRLISETGTVPNVDVFSYTAYGKPWIAHEWLAELMMFWLYGVGGYAGLVAIFSMVVTGAYVTLYALLRRGLAIDRTVALGIVAWTAIVRWAQWAPRPQLFTFLFFSITLYLLFEFKHNDRARLWILPPMMALWVNVHAGYMSGLLLITIFLSGETLNRLTHRPAAALLPLVLTALASIVATLANPNTYEALLYPLTYVGTGNASMHLVAEWQSPDFHQYIFLPFALSIVALMLLGFRGRFDFTCGLVVLIVTVMALQSQRHMVLFALATAPVLALRLNDMGVRLSSEAESARRHSPLINLALLTVVPVALALVLIASPYSQARPSPSTAAFPAGGVAYLKEHHLEGNLFNSYNWGGYLIHELNPDYRVFVDGRADPYGDSLLMQYARVAMVSPLWRDVLGEYGVSTVLIERGSPLSVLLASQSDWQMVYEGTVEQIYVSRSDR